jgi:hypothetical protein
MNGDVDIAHFQTFGFIVFRQAFDPVPLLAEVNQVMASGLVPSDDRNFGFVPMMNNLTPASLRMLDDLEPIATALLGTDVIPTRAKAVIYNGNTAWHADSDSSIASLGICAYFDSLDANNGALRVLPGSHRLEYAQALSELLATEIDPQKLPAHVIASEPGDLILFDEHLFHASCGGGTRKQWRLDFLTAPKSETDIANTIRYFQNIYPENWDCRYDTLRYPSYGNDWRSSGRRAISQLQKLGVYQMAQKQEDYSRPMGRK